MDLFEKKEKGWEPVKGWSVSDIPANTLVSIIPAKPSPPDTAMRFEEKWMHHVEQLLALLRYERDDIPEADYVLIVPENQFDDGPLGKAALDPSRPCLLDVTGTRTDALLEPCDYWIGVSNIQYLAPLSAETAYAFACFALLRSLTGEPVNTSRAARRYAENIVSELMLHEEDYKRLEEAKRIVHEEYPDIRSIYPILGYSGVFPEITDPIDYPGCEGIKQTRQRIEDMTKLWHRYLQAFGSKYSPQTNEEWERLFYDLGLGSAMEAYDNGVPVDMLLPPQDGGKRR